MAIPEGNATRATQSPLTNPQPATPLDCYKGFIQGLYYLQCKHGHADWKSICKAWPPVHLYSPIQMY